MNISTLVILTVLNAFLSIGNYQIYKVQVESENPKIDWSQRGISAAWSLFNTFFCGGVSLIILGVLIYRIS
jgi:hypothetical protein